MDVLLNPDKFFAEHKEIGFKLPLAIVVVFAILSAFSAYLVSQDILRALLTEKDVRELLPIISAFATISAIVSVFLLWIILTAILYILSAIFGGKGKFSTLMKFLALSFIPAIILSPINLYLSMELFKSPTAQNLYAMFISSSIVIVWQFIYFVFAVKNARELSVKKSAIVCAIPVVIWLVYSLYSINMQLESLQILRSFTAR